MQRPIEGVGTAVATLWVGESGPSNRPDLASRWTQFNNIARRLCVAGSYLAQSGLRILHERR